MADEEGTVTLGDVLALQDHLEESAVAVLGAADDKNCTYSQGYVKRQALYACLTCNPDICDPAGFCLACNYHCHEGHDIVELYTKRNFRCDCGNSKFGEKKCTLEPAKDELNINNVYNQNFKGKYCTCSRPYPDEENPSPDEMIQCALCEDWYHTGHLGLDLVPDAEDYSEMTCPSCVNKYPVLKLYSQLLVKETKSGDGEKEVDKADTAVVATQVDVQADVSSDDAKSVEVPKSVAEPGKHGEETPSEKLTAVPKVDAGSSKDVMSATPGNTATDKSTESDVDIEAVKPKECLIKGKDVTTIPPVTGALFWEEGWRSQLCSCEHCLIYYSNEKIPFITDLMDTVEVYEQKNVAESAPPNPDADLAFLSRLDRVQQVEIISEYNDMKEKLVEYLKHFGEEKKVVKAEDIHKFFSNLNDCKRRRLNDDLAPSDFCR